MPTFLVDSVAKAGNIYVNRHSEQGLEVVFVDLPAMGGYALYCYVLYLGIYGKASSLPKRETKREDKVQRSSFDSGAIPCYMRG